MGLPPRVPVERVIVVAKVVDDDIQFRVIVPVWQACAVSEVMTLVGQAPSFGGNPYLIYGADIAAYAGVDQFDVSISVAVCNSGEI